MDEKWKKALKALVEGAAIVGLTPILVKVLPAVEFLAMKIPFLDISLETAIASGVVAFATIWVVDSYWK